MDVPAENDVDPCALEGIEEALAVGVVDREIPAVVLFFSGDVPGRFVERVDEEGVVHDEDVMFGGRCARQFIFEKMTQFFFVLQARSGESGIDPGEADFFVDEGPGKGAEKAGEVVEK